MKKIYIILVIFFLSGCSLLFFRESYILDNYANWINKKTGQEVSNEDFGYCDNQAVKIVTGKSNYENISLDDFYKTYPILGKCLYERGYVFRIKSVTYCYNKPKICEAYKGYIRWF